MLWPQRNVWLSVMGENSVTYFCFKNEKKKDIFFSTSETDVKNKNSNQRERDQTCSTHSLTHSHKSNKCCSMEGSLPDSLRFT